MNNFDIKQTIVKVLRIAIIYWVPMLINYYIAKYPVYSSLTVSAAIHLIYDYLKRSAVTFLP
ncbi:MAG: hypothetical protein KGN01_06550 [Patescibacteria group bacterium]|nr:hypothetical protein [Patescibacteria group bacterium]